ncbi:hypothetical protein GGX14DRAFT_392268 [Mycena pura]|uniref:Uncharacterized protein n=1 Tax=Mycena pura TaxID=153505 RepID=A0AAD6YG01_9AGAR|nr:hypothetical protein GGX14DRAFT_392268 [Mycena pura]
MGRRAKHFTTTERAEAQRQHYTAYNQSPHGNTVRAEQNRLRHMRKVSKWSLPRLPPLSYTIESLAHVPLPENERLFQDALRSPDSLDESGLGCWKKEPPFELDPDTSDPHSEHNKIYTQNMQVVLHGVRLREQRVDDACRRDQFHRLGRKVAIERLRDEVPVLLDDWERVSALDIYDRDHHPREYVMFQHYLQWQARTIYNIYYVEFLKPL